MILIINSASMVHSPRLRAKAQPQTPSPWGSHDVRPGRLKGLLHGVTWVTL